MSISTDSDFKWTLKGDMQTSAARNQLADHIKAGGLPDDEVGRKIVAKFLDALFLSPDYQSFVVGCGFNRSDLESILGYAIAAGLDGEIPSPCVQDGFPRLLGCILLEKKEALQEISSRIREAGNGTTGSLGSAIGDLKPSTVAAIDRDNAIADATIEVGRKYYEYITSHNGAADFQINRAGSGLASTQSQSGCGCMSLILAGAIGGGGYIAIAAFC